VSARSLPGGRLRSFAHRESGHGFSLSGCCGESVHVQGGVCDWILSADSASAAFCSFSCPSHSIGIEYEFMRVACYEWASCGTCFVVRQGRISQENVRALCWMRTNSQMRPIYSWILPFLSAPRPICAPDRYRAQCSKGDLRICHFHINILYRCCHPLDVQIKSEIRE